MPVVRHDNAKFLALPVTGKNELAETPCAICERIASVKRRNDGWLGIRCGAENGCGYSEEATSKQSFESLIDTVLNEPKTVFRRASKADVLAALEISKPEPEISPEPDTEIVHVPGVENEPDELPVIVEILEDDEDAEHRAMFGE